MRLIFTVIGLLVVATFSAAVWLRSVPMPAEVWHVDPASITPPTSPNFVLRIGDDAPRLAGTIPEVAARLDAVAVSEGAERIGGDVADGFVTYVVRSRIFGFPDAVSIRLYEDGDDVRVEIFSRSRFGHSDLGVNEARVARWIDTAAS